MVESAGRQLRETVAKHSIQVPGAPSALIGKLIESIGFEAAYLSGAALSANVFALPDIGLVTLTELAMQTSYLTRSISIPVIVDADTGFGEAVNVERTVEELEHAGAAAIQFEDQLLPKKCGHLSGKTLIPPDQMCRKLRAAVNCRSDSELVIIARTDARGVNSLDDAVDRAKRYVDEGADWVFPEALTSADEFARFATELSVPLVANMTEFGKSPLLSFEALAAMGYAIVLYPVTLLRVALKAAEAALATIAAEGTQQGLVDLMQTRQELYELIGYSDYDLRDQAHFRGEPPT